MVKYLNLTFNPNSGHVKSNGAMIGRVALGDDGKWSWVPASFQSPGRVMLDDDRNRLLGRVKAELTKSRSTDTKKGY